MPDITCTSCTVDTTETVEAIAPFRNGVEVTMLEAMNAGVLAGVHPLDIGETVRTGRPKHPGLPDFEFLGVKREIKVSYPRLFDGTSAQAEAEGWQENEFGFVCPTCAGEQEEDPDTTHGAATGLDPLLTAAAGLAEVRSQPLMRQVFSNGAFCRDGTIDIDTVLDNLDDMHPDKQLVAAREAVALLRGTAEITTDPERACSLRQSCEAIEEWAKGEEENQ